MLSPIRTVLLHYPLRFFMTLLIMVIISGCILLNIKRKYAQELITKKKAMVLWGLTNYTLGLLFFTVFGRRSWDYYRYNFELGYSYCEVFLNNNYDLAIQIIGNIAIFIPVGIMCNYLFENNALGKSISVGILISLLIEILQLVLRRGCCELDDLISNSIGIIIGFLIMSMYRVITTKKVRK